MTTNAGQNDIACIILAAGKALRYGRNKLFVALSGRPLLFTVIDSIVSFRVAGKIVVVAAPPDIRRIQKKYERNPAIRVVSGGRYRVESTLRGLLAIDRENYKYVYIHDGARPILRRSDFLKLKKEILLKRLDGAVLYVPSSDSLMSIGKNNKRDRYLDKNTILHLKTPHIYKVSSIFESLLNHKPHEKKMENAEILALRGKKAGFVKGSLDNIKLTHEDDLRVIKKLL